MNKSPEDEVVESIAYNLFPNLLELHYHKSRVEPIRTDILSRLVSTEVKVVLPGRKKITMQICLERRKDSERRRGTWTDGIVITSIGDYSILFHGDTPELFPI